MQSVLTTQFHRQFCKFLQSNSFNTNALNSIYYFFFFFRGLDVGDEPEEVREGITVSGSPAVEIIDFVYFEDEPLDPDAEGPVVLRIIRLEIVEILVLSSRAHVRGDASRVCYEGVGVGARVRCTPVSAVHSPSIVDENVVETAKVPE